MYLYVQKRVTLLCRVYVGHEGVHKRVSLLRRVYFGHVDVYNNGLHSEIEFI